MDVFPHHKYRADIATEPTESAILTFLNAYRPTCGPSYTKKYQQTLSGTPTRTHAGKVGASTNGAGQSGAMTRTILLASPTTTSISFYAQHGQAIVSGTGESILCGRRGRRGRLVTTDGQGYMIWVGGQSGGGRSEPESDVHVHDHRRWIGRYSPPTRMNAPSYPALSPLNIGSSTSLSWDACSQSACRC